MSHELGDLLRDPQGKWVAICSCGDFESTPNQQDRYSMREWSNHVFEMTETSLKGSADVRD